MEVLPWALAVHCVLQECLMIQRSFECTVKRRQKMGRTLSSLSAVEGTISYQPHTFLSLTSEGSLAASNKDAMRRVVSL